jgi:MFS transporter, DHA2 family, multidrug resistance protein
VLLLPLLLVSMDVSVLYFAVPFISRDLQPSSTQQLWIFDVYGFVLAGLLITMGSLGDRIGRRRLLLTGLMPSTLALVRNMFHAEKQRRTAIAIWTSATTSGIAIGPVLSGFLLNHFWWGSVFLINVPFMIMLLILGPALVPEFRAPQAGRFDLVSSLLSLGAVLTVIYGIKEIAANGLDYARAGWIALGVAVGIGFIVRQARGPAAMIDLKLFRSRGFSGSAAMSLVSMFAVVGFAIFTTQYLQSVLGMRPLTCGRLSLRRFGRNIRRHQRNGAAHTSGTHCWQRAPEAIDQDRRRGGAPFSALCSGPACPGSSRAGNFPGGIRLRRP